MLGGLAASEVVLDKVGVEDFEAVVFIGGSGVAEFFADEVVLNIARKAAAERKVVAAISTAPTILANAGVLKGVRSTGFITQQEAMRKGGAKYTGNAVERDGLIITASDTSATLPFVQTIVSALEKKQQKPVKKPR
jgi:protease I